jgi:hypothetical protein
MRWSALNDATNLPVRGQGGKPPTLHQESFPRWPRARRRPGRCGSGLWASQGGRGRFRPKRPMARAAGAPLAGGVLDTSSLVGSMTAPRVALPVGFDLRLELRGLSCPALTVAIAALLLGPEPAHRRAGAAPLATPRPWLRGRTHDHGRPPPSFVYRIFLPASAREGLDYTVNRMTLDVVVTLGAVTAVPDLFPALPTQPLRERPARFETAGRGQGIRFPAAHPRRSP